MSKDGHKLLNRDLSQQEKHKLEISKWWADMLRNEKGVGICCAKQDGMGRNGETIAKQPSSLMTEEKKLDDFNRKGDDRHKVTEQ